MLFIWLYVIYAWLCLHTWNEHMYMRKWKCLNLFRQILIRFSSAGNFSTSFLLIMQFQRLRFCAQTSVVTAKRIENSGCGCAGHGQIVRSYFCHPSIPRVGTASLHPGNASSAFDWYLAAAQRGSATGQFLVGLAYSNGEARHCGRFLF